MNMKEQLRAVAKEYARQFGKIIGIYPDYWVGGVIGQCAFGDYFFSLEDMQEVIDHLDLWVTKYATIEKIGDEVIEWHEWVVENEFRIGLFAWLDGYRPDNSTVDYNRIAHQLQVLREIVELYPSHSVGNVIMQLEARIKEIEKRETKKN